MLRYHGAIYREAPISKRDQQEVINTLVEPLTNKCITCASPSLGRDVSQWAAVTAIQRLYDKIADDPDYSRLTHDIEGLDLTVVTQRCGGFAAWLDKHPQRDYGLKIGYEIYLEEACREEAVKTATQHYNNVVKRLDKLDGKDCYRLMELPNNPVDLTEVGIYWSVNPQKVGQFDTPWHRPNQKSSYWRFRARIDLRAINIYDTLEANMNYAYGVDEQEITMRQGAKIWVHDAQRINRYSGGHVLEQGSYELGVKVKINDWRTT